MLLLLLLLSTVLSNGGNIKPLQSVNVYLQHPIGSILQTTPNSICKKIDCDIKGENSDCSSCVFNVTLTLIYVDCQSSQYSYLNIYFNDPPKSSVSDTYSLIGSSTAYVSKYTDKTNGTRSKYLLSSITQTPLTNSDISVAFMLQYEFLL